MAFNLLQKGFGGRRGLFLQFIQLFLMLIDKKLLLTSEVRVLLREALGVVGDQSRVLVLSGRLCLGELPAAGVLGRGELGLKVRR